MADKAKVTDMQIQLDGSAVFKTVDGITVKVTFESPTRVAVEMVRDTDGLKLAPDSGNIGAVSFRDALLKRADERFNPADQSGKKPDNTPNLGEALGEIASALGIPEVAALLKPEEGTTLVDQLVELLEKAGVLFTTPEGEPHAALNIEEHVEVHEVKGTRFRRWLRAHFYATEKRRLEAQAQASAEALVASLGALSPDGAGSIVSVRKPPVVREQTLADAIAQLEAKATYERRVRDVYVRTAYLDGLIYVDLGDETWRAVEIDAEGWRVIDVPPVYFIRPKGMLELPTPEEGGTLEDFRQILTLSDSEDDRQAWALIVAFLLVTLRPDHPEFPILVLLGAQGSAKSTTSRMIRALTDPNVVEDTGEPRSKEELHIDAECSWLMAYDNLSSISNWLSDAMCRISTGSAFTKRTQYTNRDREIFKAAQPQVLNGIADVVRRDDIIARGLMVTLPTLEEHREKSAVWAEIFAARPKILGALYSAAAAGLASEKRSEEVETVAHRMADFTRWGVRAEAALGLTPGTLKQALGASGVEGVTTVLEAEPISGWVFRIARSFSIEAPWEGTATNFLDLLNDRETDEAVKRSRGWPKDARGLSSTMSRLAHPLRSIGVSWERVNRSNKGGKMYRLYYVEPPKGDAGEEEGDAGSSESVPQEKPTDKPKQGKGDAGDAGDAGFSNPTEDTRDIFDMAYEGAGSPQEAGDKLDRLMDERPDLIPGPSEDEDEGEV